MKLRLWYLILALGIAASSADAASYRVNITRKSRDVYQVVGKEIFIHTKLCLELSIMEDAILEMEGLTGEIAFSGSGSRYRVTGVYGITEIAPGNYRERITWKGNDWYEVELRDLMVKTSMCLALPMMEEVDITIGPSGSGTIQFRNGTSGAVVGIYGRMRL